MVLGVSLVTARLHCGRPTLKCQLNQVHSEFKSELDGLILDDHYDDDEINVLIKIKKVRRTQARAHRTFSLN